MTWAWKSTKLQVPIKQCLSFMEDKCFHNALATLKEFGVDWSDIAICKRKDSSDKKMDAVFFHKDRFELLVDARGFTPNNIKCKMTPTFIEILGHRVEEPLNGSKSMSLARKYQLPQAVKPEEGNCCFSTEGILLVTAPWRS
uniref:SHSP16.1 n=1 Tax=Agasicles hygrophila TaxID=715812 RepID=A0A7G8KP66_9CUCU|nr:sHSP16.1 [Agasicles hygrophila]